MFRTTLRSIAAHKVRLLATSLAIVVGVAFVSGTLILSDTLTSSFDDLFSQVNEGLDVAVTGPEDTADPFTGVRDPVPADLVDVIEDVDGVVAASPEVQGSAQLIDEDGEPIGGVGPPTLAFNVPTDERVDTSTLREGRYPTTSGEVAIDAATAETQDIAVGDTVDMVVDGPVESATVTGLVGFGDLDNLGGATLVVFDAETAFERFGQDGFTTIYAVAEDGVSPTELKDRVAAAVGGDYDVQTGEELADSQSSDISEGLGFLTTGLLVFAGVALFVGAFLIANTFSIIVAQRTRELALLRAVGASRRQVMTSVMGEALATGLIGSLVGFVAGFALAQGLFVLLDAVGVSLPSSDLVVTTGTFTAALLLGTVLTVVVAAVPAARSTRVAPVAALQAVAAPPPPRRGIVRYGLGGLVFLGGIAGLAVTLSSTQEIAAVGAAAVVTLIGAALLAPLVTRPLLAAMGAPIASARGIQGQLATENALRNPRRTAATASALMIGLALVSFIVILASSFSRSAEASIAESFAGDFQITPTGFFVGQGGPEGTDVQAQVAAVDGVEAAVVQQFGLLEVEGTEAFVSGFDPDMVSSVLDVDVLEGGDGGLLAEGLAVSEDAAEGMDLAVGDTVQLATTGGGQVSEVVVGAIFENSPVAGSWLIDPAVAPGDALSFGGLFVELVDGADTEAAREAVEAALEPYPTLQLQDLTEIQASLTSQINQLLGIVTALLGLSVIVALFGIVNTLGLSVFERTRELGLLRAVGASRSQVRSMIRWESVLIALLGAIFGLVIGVLFAWLVITALADQAPLDLTIPVGPLAGGLIASAVAGVLAAIIPARRASRIDILRSIEAQ